MLAIEFDRHRQASRRRLWLLMLGFALLGAIVLARLAHLQILHAQDYRRQMELYLSREPEFLPALRGDLTDRNGAALAQDVPRWQVREHYGALRYDADDRASYVPRLARRLVGKGKPFADRRAAEEAVLQQVEESRQRLALITGVPLWQILQAEDRVVERVTALREYLAARKGYDEPIRELDQYHPVLSDLPAEVANQARLQLRESYPWFRVEASPARQYLDEPSLTHLVGRLGAVTPEDLEQDPNADDELACLLSDELLGKTGAERLAQDVLRGRRGMIVRNRDGDLIERIEPLKAEPVALTIDLDLQRWIYHRLGKAVMGDPAEGVPPNPTAAGAAAVVLDVQTREVLALVSWPGYTRDQLAEGYRQLLTDSIRLPWRFKAVSDAYTPGSIVKPVTVLAALTSGVVGPDDPVDCRGALDPGQDAWRCWTVWRGMPPHGPVTAVEALQHSCNVYCYTMGRRLGVGRLTHWMELLGLGQYPGIGLIEAANGIAPTPEYLLRVQKRQPSLSDALNYSIGQGEVNLTPLQAANLGATLATGVWQPVTLLRGRPSGPRRPLPGDPRFWQLVREGMERVVNDPAGTAYRYARSDGLPIAGKTGTAQTVRRRCGWTYQVRMKDGSTRTMEFASPDVARLSLAEMPDAAELGPGEPSRLWPPLADPAEDPTHAWFMGFAPARQPRIAVAVLIEYGGSGGRVAGPVARDIIERSLGFEPQRRTAVFDDGSTE